MSCSRHNLKKFEIPLMEIKLATRDFSPECKIEDGGRAVIYKGQLSNRTVAIKRIIEGDKQEEHEFHNELHKISMLHHQHIISFIGYYFEPKLMIMVYEYAVNRSVAHHLKHLTSTKWPWVQRLKICIGVAKGLEYLHSGTLGENKTEIVIHTALKSTNILLDDNLEAKISGFGLSDFSDGDQPAPTRRHRKDAGNIDPIKHASGTASDVYSFGILLFEMLSGRLANGDDHNPQILINEARRYKNDGFDKLIDAYITDQIDTDSLQTFKDVAYQCINLTWQDRPKMDTIIKRINEALDFQNHKAASIDPDRSLERLIMPLNEVNFATRDLKKKPIGMVQNASVYIGNLSENRQNCRVAFKRFHGNGDQAKQKFENELKMMFRFNHENIINFIGYCNEGNEMVIVSEYAKNHSLAYHFRNFGHHKRRSPICLTWEQRLKICIGAARALKYLHSGIGDNQKVIHRDITSDNILLVDNLEAKISGFAFSILVNRDHKQVAELAPANPKSLYTDPIYIENRIPTIESDVYSFGVVLFEMLTGKLVNDKWRQPTLLNMVNDCQNDRWHDLIDPQIRDEKIIESFDVFVKIAYQCINMTLDDRPSMNKIIKSIEDALTIQNHPTPPTEEDHDHNKRFLIPLEEITLASGDFSEANRIGDGGFGVVYKGKLSEMWQNRIVAIKRGTVEKGQGNSNFLNEVDIISRLHHQNIISFVGYCNEGKEMIIVYEYATNYSLDYHLQGSCRLTWANRLKICLGAARGLAYLHSPVGKNTSIIHRDIKSGNILLDGNLEAKISDFGLSKRTPKSQPVKDIKTIARGTDFYMDPSYVESGILTKESDVYSFGMVMLELLSGKLAYQKKSFGNGDPLYLITFVRGYYKNEPDQLIDPVIRDEIDNHSVYVFIELAFQCISLKSKERPTMDKIVEKMEDAIDDFQEHVKRKKMKT